MKDTADLRPFTRLEKYLLRDDEVAGLEGIDPDPVLPAQGSPPRRISPGLIRLITAVIGDAARILERGPTAYHGSDEYKHACHWAFLEHSDRPFSFNWCCDALALLTGGSRVGSSEKIRRELWKLYGARSDRGSASRRREARP